MARAIKRLCKVRKRFIQTHANPHVFAVKGAKCGYMRGCKAFEYVCADLKMKRIITAGMVRRLYATKAVFEADSKNKRL